MSGDLTRQINRNELPVMGRAAAGHPLRRPVSRGEAIRIFTGAPMPDGTDTVMMQEDCRVENGRVRLKPGITTNEVTAIIGPPSSVSSGHWVYTRPLMYNVGLVFFDDSGHLTSAIND